MEVGIRKRAWHTCIPYTLLIYDHWGEYTLSKKTRRLVYGVYPRIPPIHHQVSSRMLNLCSLTHAAISTANAMIRYSKFVNFLNKTIQYSKNQFFYLEILFTKLSFTVMFILAKHKVMLAISAVSVHSIFHDITIMSLPVSDMLIIVEFLCFLIQLSWSCMPKITKKIYPGLLTLCTKYWSSFILGHSAQDAHVCGKPWKSYVIELSGRAVSLLCHCWRNCKVDFLFVCVQCCFLPVVNWESWHFCHCQNIMYNSLLETTVKWDEFHSLTSLLTCALWNVGGANVDSLLQVAGEVDKAFSTLVNIMTDDEHSDDEASPPTKSFHR